MRLPGRPLHLRERERSISPRALFFRGFRGLLSSHQRAMMKSVSSLRSNPSARKCPMNFRLTPQQRYRLRQTRDTTHDADILRRSLALLLLDQGRSVATIAIELGVSRQSVYNWLDRYLLAPTPAPCAMAGAMVMLPPGTTNSAPCCARLWSDRPGIGAMTSWNGRSTCSGSTWPVGMVAGGPTGPCAGSCIRWATSGNGPDMSCSRTDTAPKDAADPPAGQGLGAEGRPALRGRDGLVAVPAVACLLGAPRKIGEGRH